MGKEQFSPPHIYFFSLVAWPQVRAVVTLLQHNNFIDRTTTSIWNMFIANELYCYERCRVYKF